MGFKTKTSSAVACSFKKLTFSLLAQLNFPLNVSHCPTAQILWNEWGEKTPPTSPYCGLQCCCMCGWTTMHSIYTFLTFGTHWMDFFSSFHLIISPFLAINSDNWKRLCLHKSPPFIWGLISWQKTVFTCLLPIKRPHFHLTRISLILQTFFCNHTIWTAWAVFDEFTLPGMSDFGKHWWKHVVCRDKRGSLLSVEQPKWCRARAPLVVHTKIFFFHTCLPSILTHVLYHSHTGSLPPPINSIVFTVFRTHLTDYSKWKTDQKKDIFVPRRRRRHRTVDALHERHFCFFKARMKTESKCMWWT